jgi:hypothetical protein
MSYSFNTGRVETSPVQNGGSGHSAHTPVDADGPLADRQRLVVTLHHETGVPMSDTVAVDADTARLRWQVPRPHHRNGRTTGQAQAAVSHGESPLGVIQARQSALARFELAVALALSAPGAEVPQHLLLGHHRTLTQPLMPSPPDGKCVVADPLAGLVKSRNRLIPHPAAAIPLSQQRRQRRRAGAQSVPIADDVHASKPNVAVRHRPFVPGLKAGDSRVVNR